MNCLNMLTGEGKKSQFKKYCSLRFWDGKSVAVK